MWWLSCWMSPIEMLLMFIKPLLLNLYSCVWAAALAEVGRMGMCKKLSHTLD